MTFNTMHYTDLDFGCGGNVENAIDQRIRKIEYSGEWEVRIPHVTATFSTLQDAQEALRLVGSNKGALEDYKDKLRNILDL